MTGPELKQLRKDLSEAIGRALSAADMAKLCGLPPADGADTIRRWEVTGPSGPVAERLRILAMASDHYPGAISVGIESGKVRHQRSCVCRRLVLAGCHSRTRFMREIRARMMAREYDDRSRHHHHVECKNTADQFP